MTHPQSKLRVIEARGGQGCHVVQVLRGVGEALGSIDQLVPALAQSALGIREARGGARAAESD